MKLLPPALLLVMLVMLSVPANAATFTASTAAELISAIQTAEGNSEADVITLTANIDLIAANNSTDGANGLPNITTPITILGNGFTIRRGNGAWTCLGGAGQPNFRLIHVASTGELNLVSVTLSEGCPTGAALNNDGAGIFNRGTIRLIDTVLSNNTANLGGGMYNIGTATIIDSRIENNDASSGGGLVNVGTATLTNVVLTGNQATTGGGIYNTRSLTINNSTISDNTAGTDGAGIYSVRLVATGPSATLTVSNSTFDNNIATNNGGAIINHHIADITNSTFGGNTATNGVGGAIANASAAADMTVTNATISGNTADNQWGGIYNDFGDVTVLNSIIAANTAAFNRNCRNVTDGMVTPTNLSDDNTADGCPANFGTISPGTDYDTTLGTNGGPTQTFALLDSVGNPAIDGVTNCGLSADQRGASRDTDCDIGAYEFGDVSLPTVEFSSAGRIYDEAAGTVSIILGVSGASNFSGSAQVIMVDLVTGTAESGTDYGAFSLQTITINCSTGTCPTSASASMSIVYDTFSEPDETANFDLVGNNGFVTPGGQLSFQATIQDRLPITSPPRISNATSTSQPPPLFDPVITKLGLLQAPTTASGRQSVEWIISVSNVSDAVGQELVITDYMDASLQIESVNAPGGIVVVEGQVISVTYHALDPDSIIYFSIVATFPGNQDVSNTACVIAVNLDSEVCATGTVISHLPLTGHKPISRNGLIAAATFLVVIVLTALQKLLLS